MITIQTLVNKPVETTWKLYTEPAHIVHWNFASEDWHCPKAANDLRPGGTFCYNMAARDGSMAFDFEGAFHTVAAPRQLNYRLADGREVTVLFEDTDAGTQVTLTFEPENMHPEEMQRAGWQAILDNFKKYAINAEPEDILFNEL
jgi:uncharacterized protein YndB with AHSA1/START domain